MTDVPKKKKKKSTYYSDMCFALLILLAVSCHFYEVKPLILFSVSVLSGLIFDYIGCRIIKRKFRLKNFHTVFICGLIALMLPASVPLWVPVVGSAFAILLIKTPFGSLHNAPFSPVAAGVAFVSICRPDLIFDYSGETFGSLSVAQMVSQGSPIVTAVDLINAFIGTVPGPMGMTCTVAMLGLLCFLLIRHPKSFINSVAFLLTCFAGAVVLTAINCETLFSLNALRIICLRMCSGFTFCIAVFFVTDFALSPKKISHRIFYSVMMGVVYIVFNLVGAYEDAGCFAVLVTNAMLPLAEKYLFFKKSNNKEVVAVEQTESLS